MIEAYPQALSRLNETATIVKNLQFEAADNKIKHNRLPELDEIKKKFAEKLQNVSSFQTKKITGFILVLNR